MDNSLTIINSFTQWAKSEVNILAVGLVGSHARNAARPDSDIDFIIIVSDQSPYIDNEEWISQFGEVSSIENEDWGNLKTKRVFYKNGVEVEYNFDLPRWCDPSDPGTKRVVTDGMRILVDKKDHLSELKSSLVD